MYLYICNKQLKNRYEILLRVNRILETTLFLEETSRKRHSKRIDSLDATAVTISPREEWSRGGYIVVQTSPCGFRRPLTSPSPPQEQAPGLTLGCFSTEMSHEFRGSGWNHGTGSLCPRGGPLADSLSHVYIGQLFGLGGISSLNWFKKKVPFDGNYFLFFDVIIVHCCIFFGGINISYGISSRTIN